MTVISDELASKWNLEPVGEMMAETVGGKLGPGIDILKC